MDYWALLVTGVFTLMGGGAGALLTKRNEHRQWVRNAKQEVYSEFLNDAGLLDLRVILDGSAATPEMIAQQRKALQRLFILAPDDICEEAQNLVETVKEIARLNRNRSASMSQIQKVERKRLIDEYSRGQATITFKMKVDLHHPKHHRYKPLTSKPLED
ncbi:hypothetical protein ASH00_08940 [Arthrobacter sp. Soil782]|uniref:hypothetical protein n=1 Tax=Arthrobacter sp. Soil782 TaxID=1736410 RepID=UPI0006FDAD46|nr:hypothetical protein [Arthrobacter sp. Soil782]KRF06355.1 hypothetical protein ASH00_08940 [Arthrobacter sp. Soil782]